jgi:hypothetical protein
MSERIRTLTNTAARSKPAGELFDLLVEIFVEVENRPPNPDERRGLEQAVQDLKGNVINWSTVEKGLRDQTWVVEGGSRDLMGDM